MDTPANNKEISEAEGIRLAIQHFQEQAPRNCGVMYEPYMQVAKWLGELAAFKDETPLTHEWLTEKFGEPNNRTWLYSPDGDTDEIEVKEISDSIYNVTVNDLEFGLYSDQMCLCTRGQLRQFLSIGGTVEFVKTHLND